MDPDVRAALQTAGGMLARRDHPHLAKRLDRLLAGSRLVSPLPGILVLPGLLESPEARIAAGLLWCGPDTVVTGLAAARLTFWPDCRVDEVELAVVHHAKHSRPGWRVRQRRIPPELIRQRGRWRISAPALTAIDLAAGPLGGDIIDRVLRTKAATLAQLADALELSPDRAGNPVRARLLDDSRDEPWSEAERRLHRLFRTAGLTGWQTNVWIGDELSGFIVDVLFERHRVIVEVDGWAFHGSREAFESDRRRRNELEVAGYLVLNFTWRQIVDDPGWVLSCIARAVAIGPGYPSARKM